MSTPERSQDPGEHGYGGTNREYPAHDENDESNAPTESDDDTDDPREAPDPEARDGAT